MNDDPRGQEVFRYLGTLIESLEEKEKQNQDTFEKIDEAVSYVAEILTLQQAYAASEQETKEWTDLNLLLEDAVHMQAGALDKRGIRLEKYLTPDLPKLIIDKNRLMQVMVNFIKNSYEAIDDLNAEDAEKRITIKSFSENSSLGFVITDTGSGIDPQRIDEMTEFGKSSKGSSGFGLSYCKMFVEANKGTMKIHSPGIGKGAHVRVEFDLPAAEK